MRLNVSRYRYWYGYLILFLFLIIAMWTTDKGYDLAAWSFAIISATLFVILEYLVRREKITVKEGVTVKINSKQNHYKEFKVKQNIIQKILRIGDIEVEGKKIKSIREVYKIK